MCMYGEWVVDKRSADEKTRGCHSQGVKARFAELFPLRQRNWTAVLARSPHGYVLLSRVAGCFFNLNSNPQFSAATSYSFAFDWENCDWGKGPHL